MRTYVDGETILQNYNSNKKLKGFLTIMIILEHFIYLFVLNFLSMVLLICVDNIPIKLFYCEVLGGAKFIYRHPVFLQL